MDRFWVSASTALIDTTGSIADGPLPDVRFQEADRFGLVEIGPAFCGQLREEANIDPKAAVGTPVD